MGHVVCLRTCDKYFVSEVGHIVSPRKLTGSVLQAMDVVVACVLLKGEEVWRREGKLSALMGGKRIFV